MALPLLVLDGELFSELSLARVNRELALALLRRDDVELALSAPLLGSYLQARTPSVDRLLARTGITLDRPPDLVVRHRWPADFTRPPLGRYAHIQPYEVGALPREWIEQLDAVDEVWCYGSFVRGLYLQAGVAPERAIVVPLGVDPHVFTPDGLPVTLETRGTFRFLYVGGTIWRKGFDIALNAFLNAFKPGDDVCLVIKDVGGASVYRHQNAKQQIAAVIGRSDLAEVVYTDAVFDDATLAALYRTCDVLLAPYRGEGFGLPVLEAMACGTPAIVTAGGATDDFVDDTVGIRVPAQRIVVESDEMMETIDEPWALEIATGQLVQILRAVAARRGALAPLGAAASQRARTAWTWDRTAAVAAERARLAAALT